MYADIEEQTSIRNDELNGSKIIEMLQHSCYSRLEVWHSGPDHWAWERTRPIGDIPSLCYLIEKLAYHNYQIWHYEDPCRSGDPAKITRCKPLIDTHNQLRNNTIEEIDEILVRYQNPQADERDAVSETIASIIDRISITKLKILHVSTAKTIDVARLNLLISQYSFLSVQAARLMDDIISGRRKMMLFKQLKMYNDPKFNANIGAAK